MRWVVLLAARYVRTRRREKGNTTAVLSVLGIAAGVMTLVTVLGVMNGFQAVTMGAMLAYNSYHLRLEADDESLPVLAEAARAVPGVSAVIPFAEVQTLVRGFFSDPLVSVLRAVPADYFTASYPAPPLVQGDGVLTEGNLVLGAELARNLGLRVGDGVTVMALSGASFEGLNSSETVLRVSGLFRSGYFEYDVSWAFVGLDTARDLDPQALLGIGLLLDDRFSDRRMIHDLSEHLSLEPERIESWREYNRAMFAALRTEKLVMMTLIGLIFVVVAGNIYQSLRRSIAERAEDIAVIRSFGARSSEIRAVFIVEGLAIGFWGALIGSLFGLFISTRVNAIFATLERLINSVIRLVNAAAGGEISLFSPRYFYLTHIPVLLPLTEVLGMALVALASAGAAGWFAARSVVALRAVEVLRHE